MPGEHGLVDGLGVLLPAEDRPGRGAPQGLVGGEGDDVGVGDGRRVGAAGDEAGDVGGVDDEQRADLVGDGPEGGEVDDARVGGGPGDDGLGPLGGGQVGDLVVVEDLGLVGRRRRRRSRRGGR